MKDDDLELFHLGSCSWWGICRWEDIHTNLNFTLNQQEFLKWDINFKNDHGKENTGVPGKSKTTQKEIPWIQVH